ncbi:10809_t:CDS:2 [Entrophospora sp. SA101]|nr:10809_t:CDS:2 [Entrophospora sp. SA101]
MALVSSGDEEIMCKTVEGELQKINLENLGYAHPLSSGIMDDSSEPITEMPKELLP